MKAYWLLNPNNPLMKVLVIRGFWARQFNPRDYATEKEIDRYMLFMAEIQLRRYSDWNYF